MDEYINREAVLNAILHADSLEEAYKKVCMIPAADVKPVVRGKWEWNPDGMDWGLGAWVCGKCKSRPETWWQTVKECHPLRCAGSRFCTNCGADMREAQP